MSDPIARLNTALEGRYAIKHELGEGGMESRCRAYRNVALKGLSTTLRR